MLESMAALIEDAGLPKLTENMATLCAIAGRSESAMMSTPDGEIEVSWEDAGKRAVEIIDQLQKRGRRSVQ